MKSMTAYGRATAATPLGRFSAEIQSVNRKHLEINIFLPKELQRFEPDIRNKLSTVIARGQVTLKLFAQFEKSSPVNVVANIPLAIKLKQALESIAKELNIKEDITLEMLADKEELLSYSEEFQDEEKYRKILLDILDNALQGFNKMKLKEGENLQKDILERIKKLKATIDKIAVLCPNAAEKLRQKLTDKLNEVLPGVVENEERILREVCMYAEKADIVEEITRFNSHLTQCQSLIEKSQGPIGKTLEFILQELGREINTIGSKSADIEISKLVIEIKSELERIREQIQNIE